MEVPWKGSGGIKPIIHLWISRDFHDFIILVYSRHGQPQVILQLPEVILEHRKAMVFVAILKAETRRELKQQILGFIMEKIDIQTRN